MWQGQGLSRGRLVQESHVLTAKSGNGAICFHPHAELAIFNIQIMPSLLPFTSSSLLNFALYAHYRVSLEIRPILQVCILPVQIPTPTTILTILQTFGLERGLIETRPEIYSERSPHPQDSTGYDSRNSSAAKHQT